jgi:hypothetical protein
MPKEDAHNSFLIPLEFLARACGAVVLTVRPVEPTPVTAAGLKLHVLSFGSPAHEAEEKLIVPE